MYPTTTSHVIIVAGLWDTELQCPLRLARFAQLRPDVYERARNDTLAPDSSRRNDCDIELRARNGLGDDRRLFDLQTIFVDSALARRLDSVNAARNVVYGSEVNRAVMAAGMNRYRFTRFEAMTIPALVIAGKHDGAAIPAGLRPLSEKLPHARYVEFESSGQLRVSGRARSICEGGHRLYQVDTLGRRLYPSCISDMPENSPGVAA
jgi:pimeloyl-ACP methyl ester carboxylesterase